MFALVLQILESREERAQLFIVNDRTPSPQVVTLQNHISVDIFLVHLGNQIDKKGLFGLVFELALYKITYLHKQSLQILLLLLLFFISLKNLVEQNYSQSTQLLPRLILHRA